MDFVWFAISYVIFCFIVAAAAGSRGRSGFGWFLLSLVISPLLALIFVLVIPNLHYADAYAPLPLPNSPDSSAALKTCPRCAETVKRAAQVCRFCGHEFDGKEPTGPDRRVYRGFEYVVGGSGVVTRVTSDGTEERWKSEAHFQRAVDSMAR